MSRDLQLNHTSFSLLISCNKNISAQIKKFKDLFLKTMGVRERKIFSTLLPALKQVYSVRLFVCMVSFIVTIFRSAAFEVCTLIYLVTWQTPFAELAGGGTYCCIIHAWQQWCCLPLQSRGGSQHRQPGSSPTQLYRMSAACRECVLQPWSDTWALGIVHQGSESFILELNGCRSEALMSALDSLMLYVCLFILNSHLRNCLCQRSKLSTSVEIRDTCDFRKDRQCLTAFALRSLLSLAQGCICHATIRHRGIL